MLQSAKVSIPLGQKCEGAIDLVCGGSTVSVPVLSEICAFQDLNNQTIYTFRKRIHLCLSVLSGIFVLRRFLQCFGQSLFIPVHTSICQMPSLNQVKGKTLDSFQTVLL